METHFELQVFFFLLRTTLYWVSCFCFVFCTKCIFVSFYGLMILFRCYDNGCFGLVLLILLARWKLKCTVHFTVQSRPVQSHLVEGLYTVAQTHLKFWLQMLLLCHSHVSLESLSCVAKNWLSLFRLHRSYLFPKWKLFIAQQAEANSAHLFWSISSQLAVLKLWISNVGSDIKHFLILWAVLVTIGWSDKSCFNPFT